MVQAVLVGRRGRVRGRVWFWYLVGGVCLSVVSLWTLPIVGEAVVGAAAVVAVFIGIVVHRPVMRTPWLLLAIGQGLATIAVAWWAGIELVTGSPAPVPTVVDAIYLASYPVSAGGLALFVRRRVGHSWWEGVLDASLVTLGLATVMWVLVFHPYLAASGMPWPMLAAALTYPAMDLLLVALLAWLVFAIGVRSWAMLLLCASFATLHTADIVNGAVIAYGGGAAGSVVTFAGWDLCYVLLGAAALHPSMAGTNDPVCARATSASPRRVILYLALGVFSPLIALVPLLTVPTGGAHLATVLVPVGISTGIAVLLIIRVVQIASLAASRASALDRQASELRQSKDELCRAHQRLRAMFEYAPTGMAQLAGDGTVLAVNPALARFVGRSERSLIGNGIEYLVHPDDAARAFTLLRDVLRGGERRSAEIRCPDVRGEVRWAEWILSPIHTRARDGSADISPEVPAEVPVVLVIADRTEARQLEIELRHSQKLEAIGRLAAGVAHELNTPIQFIGDNVDFLNDAMITLLGATHAVQTDLAAGTTAAAADLELAYLAAEVPEALRQTKDGVRRIAGIVSALTSFAYRDSRGQRPVDVNRAISDTLTVARGELRHVTEVHVDLGVLPPVTCSIGDLNHVFLNLLINAADAVAETQTCGKPGRIAVRSRQVDDRVMIEISDSGPGIPAELNERVFEPFFTTKPIGHGTGQGLALSRTIVVDGHGGSIDFVSAPGQGTTFTVRLPLAGRQTPASPVTPAIDLEVIPA